MSRSAFADRFRLVIGESPMRYLRRYRLARAAERLRTSGESLVDIALQTGYASDVALSKAFKRSFGLSPGAFRHGIQAAGEPGPRVMLRQERVARNVGASADMLH
jgi:AraC-like DNA-binding protein